MGVQAVVHDPPVEPLPERVAEGPPERALDQKDPLADLEGLARLRQREERPGEGAAAQPAVPGIVPPHPSDGEQGHPRRHPHRFRGLAGPGQGAVEDPPVQPGQSLGELLRALATIGPGDDRQDHDVRAAGSGLAGIQGQAGQLRRGLAQPQQALGGDASAQGAPPGKRNRAATERVDPPAPAGLPVRSHAGGTNGAKGRWSRIEAMRSDARPSP